MYNDDALLIKNRVPSDANDRATPHCYAFLSWRRGLDPVFSSNCLLFLAPSFHYERTLLQAFICPGAFRTLQPLEATQSRG